MTASSLWHSLLSACNMRQSAMKDNVSAGQATCKRSSEESQSTRPAESLWRCASNDCQCILLDLGTGTVIELLRSSTGWFQCRDSKWKMHTLFPDGHVDRPRVQVFDGEHLLMQIRQEEERGISRSLRPNEFGNWQISESEHGRMMVTHKRQRNQILVIMPTGFTFVGSDGHTVLVDESGLEKLSHEQARAMMR